MICDCADIYNSLIVCTILEASARGVNPSTQWDMRARAPCAPDQLPLNHLYCLTVHFAVLAAARFYLLKSALVFALNVHLHLSTPERVPKSLIRLSCLLRVHRIQSLRCSFNSAHSLLVHHNKMVPLQSQIVGGNGHTERKLEPGTPAKGSRTFSRLVHLPLLIPACTFTQLPTYCNRVLT